MAMLSALRRTVVAAALTVGIASTVQAPAQADPFMPIDWKVDATTTMKSLKQTVVVPTGSFKGQVDLETMALSGDMKLPQATKRLDIGALPVANVTFAMEQAAPVTGQVDLASMTATTTAKFNVRLVSVRPVLTPWVNLVGNNCRTATPVTTTLGGPLNLVDKTTFSGTYALPKFTGCGLFVTPMINAIVPGPGNTFSATFYP